MIPAGYNTSSYYGQPSAPYTGHGGYAGHAGYSGLSPQPSGGDEELRLMAMIVQYLIQRRGQGQYGQGEYAQGQYAQNDGRHPQSYGDPRYQTAAYSDPRGGQFGPHGHTHSPFQSDATVPDPTGKLAGVNEQVRTRFAYVRQAFLQRYGADLSRYVSSGHRDHSHNASVGGARDSMHIYQMAIDLDTKGFSDEQRQFIAAMCLRVGLRGIGVYSSGSMHIDGRNLMGRPEAMWGSSRSRDSAPQWLQALFQQIPDGSGPRTMTA